VLSGESRIRPESVQKYLESKFGAALEDVSNAMMGLAKSLPPSQLAERPIPCTRNSGRKFLPAKKDGEPPASWNWTSSARWLRFEAEEYLFNSFCWYRMPGLPITRSWERSWGKDRAK